MKNVAAKNLNEKLSVFHRIIVALSHGTIFFKHRDIHPGNIILMPASHVSMGPEFTAMQFDPGIRIIDWGEALPVIFGNYDDEPEHNFTLLKTAPTMIGGSITSLPPEVFSPWKQNADFGGLYESWGMGLLLHRIFLNEELPRAKSLGHYVESISNGSLQRWVDDQVAQLKRMSLPGGLIIPQLLKQMLEISADSRLELSRAARILWDIRYEKFSITDEQTLFKYFSSPNDYEPPDGWTHSFFPDYD